MDYTINDIATLAGVSKATVSRVINNSKPVSSHIKNKVLKIISQTNFKPSQVARSLSNRETKLIGVIVPDLSNPIFSQIISGAELEAVKNKYNILLCNSMHQIDTEINYLDILIDKKVDGLIYNGFKITEDIKNKLKNFNVPIVMIGIGEKDSIYPIVKIDNYTAAYDAVNFLIQNGHKNISMIHGSLDDPFAGKLRLDGYMNALKDNSLDINRSMIIEGKYKIPDGYKAMSILLKSENKPTAIFCANDEMAIGVIKCVIDNELKVPDDISVIGFDNIELAGIYSPSLTTVSQSFTNKGRSAMELIIKMINKEDVPHVIMHDHIIIERDTVKKI